MQPYNSNLKIRNFILAAKYLRICLFRSLNTDIWKRKVDVNLYKETESYWKEQFAQQSYFDKTKLDEKYYVLSMFPYPSGSLHMGHMRIYTLSDALSIYYRLNGKNVFQPIGWDAFGLPAENAAFDHQIAPDIWTKQNIEHMKKQLQNLSLTFDWNHEINTSDPKYYRWTQYIFLKMYEAGLIYQREALVNWDPVDETVLADEQVDKNGHSWRSGAKVTKKPLEQWFIRTTKFSKILYDGLNDPNLVNWDDVPLIQKNWIGDCNGFSFDLKFVTKKEKYFVNVWVQDPLLLLKTEFVVIKPGSFIDKLDVDGDCECEREISGLEAENPFTDYLMPVYVSSEVEFPLGKDVYLGAPSVYNYDKEFGDKRNHSHHLYSKCGESLNVHQVLQKAEMLGIGGYPASSKLTDWLISRQRYWGTPIPLIHCKECGTQPVPYEDLPVTLPPIPEGHCVDKNLYKLLWESNWRHTSCPKCGELAFRETDTMDTFFDSSWYYLRYVDHDNDIEPFNSNAMNKMLPVDIYIGGKEHALLHLYYARFISYFLCSIGLTNFQEPFANLLCQGKVRNKTYKNAEGRYFKPEQIEFRGNEVFSKDTGEQLICTVEKMGKSRYNGIEPDTIIEKYGIDTMRLFLWKYSPSWSIDWDSKDFNVIQSWQYRMWLTIRDFLRVRSNPLKGPQPVINMREEEATLKKARNSFLGEVTHHYERTRDLSWIMNSLQLSTIVLRKPAREVRKYSEEYEKFLATFLIMLAPLAPHFSSTLWSGFIAAPGRFCTSNEINWDETVLKQKWPQVDPDHMLPVCCQFNDNKPVEIGQVMNQRLSEFCLKEAFEFLKKYKRFQEISESKKVKLTLIELEKLQAYRATVRFTLETLG